MNLPVVLVLAYVALGLELALKPGLALGTSIAPGVLLPMAVFIALYSQPRQALWVGLVLGVALDLTSPIPMFGAARNMTLLGPNALGYLAATYLTLTIRGLLVRRNPLTLLVVSVIAMALAQIVLVAILSVRSFYDSSLSFGPLRELTSRLLSSLYTAGTAGIMGLLLVPLAPWLGFHDPASRRMGRRP
ncbi:MAG: hypothetical protein H7Y88_01955 [Phycisphaerales bacterium]|nr:hypothetical protein [Phycisphaerales bacterium]